jgi:tetratricopeptide (TPR) repeat protein
MAHWLAASVLTARGLLTEADDELQTGLTAITEHHPWSPFGVVALHWLRGLVLLARGARSDELDAFHRELDAAHSGHLYAEEVAANTWYAIGATRVAAGDRNGAQEAFLECLRRVPKHLLARAALGEASPATGPSGVDQAIAQAIYLTSGLASDDDRAESHVAASVVERALAAASAGNAGWLLPVEPMLAIASCPAPWLGVLARLRSRAA